MVQARVLIDSGDNPGPGPASRRGEVLEWLNRHAWKACGLFTGTRGFESHPLRQIVVSNQFSVVGGFVVAGAFPVAQHLGLLLRPNSTANFVTNL